MRNLVFSLTLSWIAAGAQALEVEDYVVFGDPAASEQLKVLSTADTAFFAPMVQSFLDATDDVNVAYTVASSAEVMRALVEDGAAFDLAISSAMNLQTKLANDGLARPHEADTASDLPDWAVWNDMVFAFTQEPAAIVLSKAEFEGMALPESRQDLISLLRQNPERFRGRIGTYDVRRSGLGYLFATQDARTSDTYWRLTEVMGSLEAKLYCCSSDMLDGVRSGELAIAYNVLGSYAAGQLGDGNFHILLPGDFTTIMLRTVLIPITSEQPEMAGQFIDHMLQQTYDPQESRPLTTGLDGLDQLAAVQRIRLGPGLLVFLDQFKKRRFLQEWESAILQSGG